MIYMHSMELDLQGWMFEGEQRWLYETAFRLPDHAAIVEIGSWKGLSTSNLCKGCKNSLKKVYAIDTWEGTSTLFETYYAEAKSKDIFSLFQNNIHILGYSEIVVPIKGESTEVAKEFQHTIDFLFVDANHSEASIREDLAAWLPHCKDTAVVAGHDYAHWAPDVIRVISAEFSMYDNPVDSIWRSSPRYYRDKAKGSDDSTRERSESDVKFTFVNVAYNFSHRLKLCLQSLRLQSFPLTKFEILIGNPQSPDDLLQLIEYFNTKYPELSLRAINFAPSVGFDRGRIYNELAWEAKGKVLCFIDADAVLPPDALKRIEIAVDQYPQLYHSCYRRDVPIDTVSRFIAGELNLKEHMDILFSAAKTVHTSKWAAFVGKIGFLQIVNRESFLKVRYSEGHLSVSETDVNFADRYIWFVGDTRTDFRIPGLEVFHLDHKRSWEGISETQ